MRTFLQALLRRLHANNNLLQPNAVPWGWWDIARVVALLLASLLFIFLVYFITIVIQTIRGIGLDPSIGSVAIGVGLYATWLVAIYWCSVRRYGISWSALGLRRVAWWWILACPVCLIGMFILSDGVQAGMEAIRGQPFVNPQIEMTTHGQPVTLPYLILLLLTDVVATPIVEELFFRGMLYPLMRQATGPWIAVVLNAGIFALVHGIPILIPTLFVAGVVFTLVRERTNSLLPGIGIHALQNVLYSAENEMSL